MDLKRPPKSRRGYDLDVSQDVIARFRQKNLAVSVAYALGYHASILGAAAVATSAAIYNPLLGIALYPIAAFLIARQQRGLELMVHDASHQAWSKIRWLNDRAADVLVAWPSFQSLSTYWTFHRSHHAEYGSPSDPCRRRFEQIRTWLKGGSRARALALYIADYYREVARSPATIARAALWHAVVFLAPLGLAFGAVTGLLMWASMWLVPQMLVLPVLRVIAELEEHDYSEPGTEADTTFTNIGWLHRWLIHPFHDCFHWVHHMFSNVPQWRHKALHQYLLEHSAAYRKSLGRHTILGDGSPLNECGKTDEACK